MSLGGILGTVGSIFGGPVGGAIGGAIGSAVGGSGGQSAGQSAGSAVGSALGSGAASQAAAQQYQQAAINAMNAAYAKQQQSTTGALNDYQSRAAALQNPATAPQSAYTGSNSQLAAVTAPQMSSVLGTPGVAGNGVVPSVSAPANVNVASLTGQQTTPGASYAPTTAGVTPSAQPASTLPTGYNWNTVAGLPRAIDTSDPYANYVALGNGQYQYNDPYTKQQGTDASSPTAAKNAFDALYGSAKK